MSNELQIEDIVVGDGKAVVKGALITTQYKGTLEDGTVFDSSYEKGRPFQCVIGTGRVIKGWDQGLMGMKVGGKRKLFVPAHLPTASGRSARTSSPTPTCCSRSNCWKSLPATIDLQAGAASTLRRMARIAVGPCALRVNQNTRLTPRVIAT